MYKIGEFSTLSKTTVKALRYYEQEKLLVPAFVDPNTNYRFYEANQLIDLSKIISLKQTGLSIKEIKKVLSGGNIRDLLEQKKIQIENDLNLYNIALSKINYLLEEENMNNEIFIKELPSYTIYYKEGVIKTIGEITNFILSSAEECLKDNPNIKCTKPDYCYVNYLDGEYKDRDIAVRYAQAVEEVGVENKTIKFMQTEPSTAACIYHKGSYETIRESYGTIIKYIEDNGYEIIDFPRERYIDGMWNKENEEDWLTEIQVPIIKK